MLVFVALQSNISLQTQYDDIITIYVFEIQNAQY